MTFLFFFLGGYLLDSEFVPTAATREILIVFPPVLLPAVGRKESRVGFLPGPEKVKLWAVCQVSPTLRFHKIEPFFFNRSVGVPEHEGMGFHSRDRLVYVLGASPDCLKMRARYDKGPLGGTNEKPG